MDEKSGKIPAIANHLIIDDEILKYKKPIRDDLNISETEGKCKLIILNTLY